MVDPHLLDHLLHHDLDEDSGRRRRFLLIHVNHVEHCPGDTVRCEEVAKESTDVSQLVGLVSVDRVVVRRKGFLE